MENLTYLEIEKRREELESEAVTQLGKMLFAFSKLDMNLGLCVVWTNGGSQFERLTEKLNASPLHSKLSELAKYVETQLPKGTEGYIACTNWLSRAHQARTLRNQLVHGRWGIEPCKDRVVNVLGLPTSPLQQSVEFTIEELATFNQDLRILDSDLSTLREKWLR